MSGIQLFESIAEITGGLGLFFAGVWLLTENLKSVTGTRVRRAVLAWTRKPVRSLGGGVLVGAVTQSPVVAILALGSMISAGFMTVSAALPILIGANIGTSLLVFLASFDVRLIMLLILGVSGIAISDGRIGGGRLQPFLGATLGLSLLFLGLDLLQKGAVPLVQTPWAGDLLRQARGSYVIGLALGAVLTILAQSVAAISILAISMASAGIFTVDDTLLTIYGANLGGGVIAYVMSTQLQRQARQLAAFQAVSVNLFGTLILLVLYIAETEGGVPLVKSGVAALTDSLAQQMAFVYLFITLTGVVLLPFREPAERILDNFFPPTKIESDAQPQYIYDTAVRDPESAVELSLLEQQRLVSYFPEYFETLRDPDTRGVRSDLDRLHSAFAAVQQRVCEFAEELAETSPTNVVYEHSNNILSNQRRLNDIEHTLYELTIAMDACSGRADMTDLIADIVEALDTVMLTLVETAGSGDPYDFQMLHRMTGDRGNVMARVRQTYLSGAGGVEPEEKVSLLQITNYSERLVWLLGELLRSGGLHSIARAARNE